MLVSPRRWRAQHLLGAWIVYWLALAAVTLGPAARAVWRMRGAPKNTASAALNLNNGMFHGTVKALGGTTWEGTATSGSVLLALVGPPLVLWVLWLLLRPRGGVAGGPEAPRGLGAGTPDWERGAPVDRDAVRTPPRGDR